MKLGMDLPILSATWILVILAMVTIANQKERKFWMEVIGVYISLIFAIIGTFYPMHFYLISDDTPILTADNILASFENAIPKAVKDDAFANIRHMVFDKTMLVYYPVESPEKNGDYTYIPTWVFCGHDSGSNNFAIYINAIDGSLAGVE